MTIKFTYKARLHIWTGKHIKGFSFHYSDIGYWWIQVPLLQIHFEILPF